MQYDLLGIGNALLDFQIQVPDQVLNELNVVKASMTLVDSDYQLRVFSELHQKFGRDRFEVNSGGSAANTVAGFANFGGRAYFVGKLGKDQNGTDYAADLQKMKIGFQGRPHDELPTGTCLALITPDAERTMLTHLGAAVDLSVKDLPIEALKNSKIVYLEGYLWDSRTGREACREAAVMARQNGAKVAMSFSDSFCVDRHREDFLEMLRSSVDILFCNSSEACSATGNSDVNEAFRTLARLCPTLAVSTGPQGALLSDGFGKNFEEVETWDVKVIDKLGAGDLFASGVLFGIIHGKSLREAGYLGCYSATKVIQQFGARLSNDLEREASIALMGPKPLAQARA